MSLGSILLAWLLLSFPLGVLVGRFLRGCRRPSSSAFTGGRSSARTETLRVLALPDEERARRIGELYAAETSRELAEVLIDCEADPAARAALVGVLSAG